MNDVATTRASSVHWVAGLIFDTYKSSGQFLDCMNRKMLASSAMDQLLGFELRIQTGQHHEYSQNKTKLYRTHGPHTAQQSLFLCRPCHCIFRSNSELERRSCQTNVVNSMNLETKASPLHSLQTQSGDQFSGVLLNLVLVGREFVKCQELALIQ